MPPKKDGKKKKKSKKELEQERLLLEEQKRKEEEAQRQAEFARQREKELIEQKEREERDEYLEKQSESHEQERLHLQHLIRVAGDEVRRLNAEIESKEEWEQYCACSSLPFPKNEPEVMSFLTVFQTISEKQSFDLLRSAILQIEPLVAMLLKEYGKSQDKGLYKLAKRYADNILSLHAIIQRKIEAMTAYVLQNSESFPREPSENLLLVQELHPQCHYCLWVNYTKNPRHKSFDVRDVHIALPKTLTLSNVAISVVLDESDLALSSFYFQQSRVQHTVLHGVLFLELLDVPELPKTIDFWTIRPLLSHQLLTRTVPYPFLKSSQDPSKGEEEAHEPKPDVLMDSKESNSEGNVHEEEAIHVSFSVGSGLFIHPLASVRWWNEQTCQWEQQGISDVEIDRGKGTVHFKTTMFKPCALVQEVYSDFPFEDWKLKSWPVDNSSEIMARYVVNGKWNDAEFEISKEGVKLIRPLSENLTADFKDQYFPPTQFFMKLLRYGLCFSSPYALNETPEEKECYTSIPFKLPPLTFQLNKSQDRKDESYTLHVLMNDTTLYTAVVDFHRVIVVKERQVVFIANEEDVTRFHPDFKPHGTLLALLDELVPFAQPDWRFISNMTLVLRITCPLNIK